ncbi:hypothetical protein ACO03V_06940 [Microbacterium sp. HMH0099]
MTDSIPDKPSQAEGDIGDDDLTQDDTSGTIGESSDDSDPAGDEED